MNKKELVARIAESIGLTQAQVARALDCTINRTAPATRRGGYFFVKILVLTA